MSTCLWFPLLVVAIGAGPEGASMTDVVQGNNQFAFDLFGKLRDRKGNLAFSPYSISTALAMTSTGAAGQTSKEMVETLRLPADDRAVDSGFAALRASIDAGGADRLYRLSTANALWGRLGVGYLPEFLERTRTAYGAGLRPVDFAGEPEAARKTINAWVEAETLHKIKDLLAPSDVSDRTDLILTNAIYFKGAWAVPFPATATRDEPFHVGPSTVAVPMMHLSQRLGYLEADGFQALRLPYLGGDLSMILVLPKDLDGLDALESKLTGVRVDGWLAKLETKQVEVTTPRFKLEGAAELAGVLSSMGMTSAFGRQADFSKIATDRHLYLSAVVHKAFVEVNEEGTEAAAATGVVMTKSLAMHRPEPPVVFRADHPFLFLIRHEPSGSILFLGRVANPKR